MRQPPRLIFIPPRSRASLTPIYMAMLSLAFVGLVGLLAAFWPRTDVTSSFVGAAQGQISPAAETPDRGMRLPRKAPKPGSRTVWM